MYVFLHENTSEWDFVESIFHQGTARGEVPASSLAVLSLAKGSRDQSGLWGTALTAFKECFVQFMKSLFGEPGRVPSVPAPQGAPPPKPTPLCPALTSPAGHPSGPWLDHL